MCRVGLVGWDPETSFSATDVDVLFSGTENMISDKNIFLHLMQVNRTQKSLFRLLKGSYDAISSFPFSLECYKLFVQIRSLKLQRLKSKTQRDILYKS